MTQISAGLSTCSVLVHFPQIYAQLREIGRTYSCDDTGSEDNLLPGLANVDDVDSVRASLPEIWLHVNLQVLGSAGY